MNRTKGTYVPVDQTPGERSNGKRRQDFPNSSFDRPPHFSSVSSSSSDPPPPREPIVGVNGLSRGEASSSNSVHPPPLYEPTSGGLSRGEASSSNFVPPPPASVSTPPVSSTCPHHILRRIVFRLQRTRNLGGRLVRSYTSVWIEITQKNANPLPAICTNVLKLVISHLMIRMLLNVPLVWGS